MCVCVARLLFEVIPERFQKPGGPLDEKVLTMHRRHVVTLHHVVWEQHVDPLVLQLVSLGLMEQKKVSSLGDQHSHENNLYHA